MTPTFATRWELFVLYCRRFPHYNGSLVILTVVSLTTAKFKPLIFSMSVFTFSYAANTFILLIPYDFCLSPAQFCYISMWELSHNAKQTTPTVYQK
jgi:hypothetical protein